MTDMGSTVLSLGTGAILGFYANYFVERFKRKNTVTDANRKAYASWFTAEALLLRQMDVVSRKLVGFPTDREKHEALMVEIRSLADEGRTLIRTMNEAFLVEKSRHVRPMLSTTTNYLVSVVAILEGVAQHYKENLKFHQIFDTMADDELTALPDAQRKQLISERDQFQTHNAECPFKSTAFRVKLGEDLARVHEQVERLRNNLAGTLSR